MAKKEYEMAKSVAKGTGPTEDEDPFANLREAFKPTGYLTDEQGHKTAVVLPIETYEMMLVWHEAMAQIIKPFDTSDVLSQKELDQLFADYGVVRH